MRELLEKWATLESEKCKRSTRPNWDGHEEFEDFYIATEAGNKGEPGHGWGWQLVLSESEAYYPDKNESLGRVQWAVQQAILEKGWYFSLSYHPLRSSFKAEVANKRVWAKDLTEALLEGYLKAVESQNGNK